MISLNHSEIHYFSILMFIVASIISNFGCENKEPAFWGDKDLIVRFGELATSDISSISVSFEEPFYHQILIDEECWNDLPATLIALESPDEIGVGEWRHHQIIVMRTNLDEEFTFTIATRESIPGVRVVIVKGGLHEFDHLAFFVATEIERWLQSSIACNDSKSDP